MSITTDPVLIEMPDLQAVATALCCRFGDATAEAYRLTTLRDVLDTSRSLAHSLEEFARAGRAHLRGVHCTADMHVELERLAERLAAWSDAVISAAVIQREWQSGGDCAKAAITGEHRAVGAPTLLDGGSPPTLLPLPA
jgi:hypothetical protein